MDAQQRQQAADLMARVFGSGGGSGGPSVAQSAAMSNPYTAAAMVAMEAVKTGNNSASNGTFTTAVDHSGWNVNLGSGSITSSATREAASQWITILAGIAALLVAYKTIRG